MESWSDEAGETWASRDKLGGMRCLKVVLVSGVSLLGCNSDPAAEETSSGTDTSAETGSGDGDGDPGDGDGDPGDGDGDPGDGDGDTGDGDCAPPDPPLAQTLDGEWSELPAPMLGFDCTLGEGDGPAWVQGVIVSEAETGIDHLAVGPDGKLYAAGWIDDGELGALFAGVLLGNGPSADELWARSWTYAGDAWGARSMATVGNGRVWLGLAPEHLLAAGEAGELIEGPIEAVTLGSRYVDTLAPGDGVLVAAIVERAAPPDCIARKRLQLHDPITAESLAPAPALITGQVFGVGGDGSGGGWMATLDLNGAALTAYHYGMDGALLGSFSVTNQGNNVIAADMAIAPDGDLVFALRSLGFIEVQRFSPDGTSQWNVSLPDFGGQYGEPHVAIGAAGDAVVAVTAGTGFLLAQVSGNGNVDWAGHRSCGGDPTEVHDVVVGGSGIWVGGVQMGASSVAWVGNL
jgi:hypothetical protein